MDPRNLSWVLLAASAISSLYSSADAHSAARRTTTPGPAPAAPALLADQALRDPRFTFPVVVVNIVGIVPAVPRDFARVELAPATVIGFDLISLAEPIAAAVGVAAPAVKRRDEARFDSRLGFAIVLCERPLARDPKKVSGAEAHVCNVESTVSSDARDLARIFLGFATISCLYSCSDSHATARWTAAPGPAPAPTAPALLADEALLDPRLAFPVVIGNILCCDRPGVMKCLEKYIRRRSLT